MTLAVSPCLSKIRVPDGLFINLDLLRRAVSHEEMMCD